VKRIISTIVGIVFSVTVNLPCVVLALWLVIKYPPIQYPKTIIWIFSGLIMIGSISNIVVSSLIQSWFNQREEAKSRITGFEVLPRKDQKGRNNVN